MSLTWLGRAMTNGFIMESTKAEIFSVGPRHAEMMGLPGLPGLWILGSRYSDGRHGVLYVRFRWALDGG